MPGHRYLAHIGTALRVWLVVVAFAMSFNGFVANRIVLSPLLRPIPFFLMAAVAAVWAIWATRSPVTIACSALLSVGIALRAVEVALYADDYDTRARATGVSMWLMIAAAMLVFGFLNLLANAGYQEGKRE